MFVHDSFVIILLTKPKVHIWNEEKHTFAENLLANFYFQIAVDLFSKIQKAYEGNHTAEYW